MNDETLINSMEPAWSRQVFNAEASHARRVLGNGAADTGPMAGICPEGFLQIAPTGPPSSQVIYFFAVFSVHYVGEVFRDDVVTSNLSSNMGETMFTLPETEVFKRCQKHSKVHSNILYWSALILRIEVFLCYFGRLYCNSSPLHAKWRCWSDCSNLCPICIVVRRNRPIGPGYIDVYRISYRYT